MTEQEVREIVSNLTDSLLLWTGAAADEYRDDDKRELLALATFAEQLRHDAARGLTLFHGTHCAMRGGPYPTNPAECSDAQCREWNERIKP